jgi:hypothetical protein
MLELTACLSMLVPKTSVRRAPNVKTFRLAELVIKPKRKHKSHKFVKI